MRMALIMVGRGPRAAAEELCCIRLPSSSFSCSLSFLSRPLPRPVPSRSRAGSGRTSRAARDAPGVSRDGKEDSHEGRNTSRSGGRPSRDVTSRHPRSSGIMAEPEEQPSPVAAQSGGRNDGRSDGGVDTPEGGAVAGPAEPGPPPAGSPGTEEPAGDSKKKIDVLLKAVGDTPIMRTKKWAVERTRTIQGLVDFIKKFLKLMASEQLFIYVNQSFAPSPDQEVGTLYECFGSDGKLVLHYCKTQAWG
uniref:Ubiquitin-like protein ATG12 n=1 Tax=Cyanoderma ruficeps TaxID=181631 RepID=A0A8C3NX87_9PASS